MINSSDLLVLCNSSLHYSLNNYRHWFCHIFHMRILHENVLLFWVRWDRTAKVLGCSVSKCTWLRISGADLVTTPIYSSRMKWLQTGGLELIPVNKLNNFSGKSFNEPCKVLIFILFQVTDFIYISEFLLFLHG
jgi:hypothetical protein